MYLLKLDEARRWAAATAPDDADYPLLSAEVGITAPTIAGVAATVLGMSSAWIAIAAAIETARLGAKAAIAAAEDQTAVMAAATVTFPQP